MRVARSRGSAQGSSAWLEPRAVTGWRKRARRLQGAGKGLISFKTTGEQGNLLLTVGGGGARRPRPREGVKEEMLLRARGPLHTKGAPFFGVGPENVGR